MTASEFLAQVLDPGIAWYSALPGWTVPTDDRARLMGLVIPGQESGYSARVQAGNGAAHSFYQMERGGGVAGVLLNPVSAPFAAIVCSAVPVEALPVPVWSLMAIAKGDRLAVAFWRLLLLTDPRPNPDVGDEQGAFDCYVRNWRPGAVSEGGDRAVQARDRFHVNYMAAMAAIKGTTA